MNTNYNNIVSHCTDLYMAFYLKQNKQNLLTLNHLNRNVGVFTSSQQRMTYDHRLQERRVLAKNGLNNADFEIGGKYG